MLERGVSPEEIKLYGEEDSDDALEDPFSEDGFTELEAIISQVFFIVFHYACFLGICVYLELLHRSAPIVI